jgi:hypothetical protein
MYTRLTWDPFLIRIYPGKFPVFQPGSGSTTHYYQIKMIGYLKSRWPKKTARYSRSGLLRRGQRDSLGSSEPWMLQPSPSMRKIYYRTEHKKKKSGEPRKKSTIRQCQVPKLGPKAQNLDITNSGSPLESQTSTMRTGDSSQLRSHEPPRDVSGLLLK